MGLDFKVSPQNIIKNHTLLDKICINTRSSLPEHKNSFCELRTNSQLVPKELGKPRIK
jgi:hypothetical protein